VHKLHILEVNSAQIATKYQNPFKNTQKRCQLSQIVEMGDKGDEFVDFDDDESLNVGDGDAGQLLVRSAAEWQTRLVL